MAPASPTHSRLPATSVEANWRALHSSAGRRRRAERPEVTGACPAAARAHRHAGAPRRSLLLASEIVRVPVFDWMVRRGGISADVHAAANRATNVEVVVFNARLPDRDFTSTRVMVERISPLRERAATSRWRWPSRARSSSQVRTPSRSSSSTRRPDLGTGTSTSSCWWNERSRSANSRKSRARTTGTDSTSTSAANERPVQPPPR